MSICRVPLAAWSGTFQPYITEALLNPLEEAKIKQEIVSLGNIADLTSQLVQSQYEDNPYPRWTSISIVRNRNLGLVLRQLFPHFVPPPFLDGPIQILVAGCGTGKHPIQTAINYSNADILAVDISKSSLAYATRMARKYDVRNIKFMQGDILELAKLNQRFHIIECVGVLHHMEDPMAGWKVLTNLLVDNGLMLIGLYSELARKPIVAARDIIMTEGLRPNISSIRNFRARILRHEFGDFLYEMARNSSDFYSTSGCRDLLFHYQEHRYALPQLSKQLNELNLDFIGFIFDNVASSNLYRDQFPEDKEMKDLNLWDKFEHLHPNTFGRMYNFWCQNKAKNNYC
jgi:2-polyprenyl-3-methyl-5-hydroxy-6-metoxy-1,4-benzoquinol methylase